MTGALRWLDRAALESVLGIEYAELEGILRKRNRYYRPVRFQSRGKARWLHVPSGPLKDLQARFTRKLLNRISPHPAAFCCNGRGAIRAARLHCRHPYILHLDIADFFPSITQAAVRETFRRLGLSQVLSEALAALVTYRDLLPQGAPSSVAVSNFVLTRLDYRLYGLCLKNGLTYTRYVDDVAISGGSRLSWIERQVRRIFADEGWALNAKGGLMRPDQRHIYLGLVVNADLNVDPKYLQDLKRALEQFRTNIDAPDEQLIPHLRGRLDYLRRVDPKIGNTLLSEYGSLLAGH